MKRLTTRRRMLLTVVAGAIFVASFASTSVAVSVVDVLWHEDFNYPNAADWNGSGPWTSPAQMPEPWYTELTDPLYSIPAAELQTAGNVSLNGGIVSLSDGMIGASVPLPNPAPAGPRKYYTIVFGGDPSNPLSAFAHTAGGWVFASSWASTTEWVEQEIWSDAPGSVTDPITLEVYLWNHSGTTEVDWVEFRVSYEGEAPPVVPAPGAVPLTVIGASLVARLRRRGTR